jgi:hypothetical protein
MIRLSIAALLTLPLVGCVQPELASAAKINADKEAYTDEVVRLQGRHVKENGSLNFITTAPISYFVLEDDSGKIRVWYNTARRRCPPRIGAQLTVEGKVVDTKSDIGHAFTAESISINDEPPLAANEVRSCQLSYNEAEIEATRGREALLAYWREQGKPDRVLVYD